MMAQPELARVPSSLFSHADEDRSGGPPSVDQLSSMDLASFATAGLVVEVHSELLGESVLFASDNARVPAAEGRPVFRRRELEEILRSGVEALRRLHAAKGRAGGSR